MWNKDEQSSQSSQSKSPSPSRSTSEPEAPASPRSQSPSGELTRIGPSVSLRGTLRCEEDLRIEGRLQGEVSVPEHRVVIGSTGRVEADVRGRVVEVEGRVVGDLVGTERVVVAASGNVEGNIKAPRVSLENGAQFKGSIDMDPGATSEAAAQRKGPKQAPAATPSGSSAGENKTGVSAS